VLKYILRGEVVKVHLEHGSTPMFHGELPGFMKAMPLPYAMEFLAPGKRFLAALKPGMKSSATLNRPHS
jgi:hypothetical protein